MTSSTPSTKLDAPKELQDWFMQARPRLPKDIAVEIRLPKKDSHLQNEAMVGLDAGDIVCSLALAGGSSIDLTILAYTKAQTDYGAIEYIVENVKLNQNLRCKDVIINDISQLRETLDQCLDDFIKLASKP